MVYVYTLLLEQNKYYVGKTDNPRFRIESHFNACGSAWTKKYPPLKLLELIPDCDHFDEDKYTKVYMNNYGINNVRGGSFCQIELDKRTYEMLEKMIFSATDKCYLCGEEGHFVKKCPSSFNNEKNTDIYNKMYTSRCQVDSLDCKFLQKLIFDELLSKKKLDIEEIIISHIFEHKDVGCRRGRNWHLRQYTNGYLTNYGNILICKSNFGNYPKIDDRSITKQLVSNKKLPELIVKRLSLEKFDVTHPSKLKNKLSLILQDCDMWLKLL